MNEDFTPDLLTVADDEGNEHTFEILDSIETDTDRYVAVTAYYDNPEEMIEDDGELIILKVEETDGDSFLSPIEDDAEFDEIAAIFEERLSEIYDISDEN